MARAIAALVMTAALSGAAPAGARGPHGSRGGLLFAGQLHHGHPINAWLGSRRLRLR